MTVWFSNSTPLKGVCIDTFTINEFGEIVDETMPNDSHQSSGMMDSSSYAVTRKSPSVTEPMSIRRTQGRRQSPTGSSTTRTTDPRIASELHVLVKDAQYAFEEILHRNANLEQEVQELRRQKTPSSIKSRLLSRRDNFPLFNISTPPKDDFIDLRRVLE